MERGSGVLGERGEKVENWEAGENVDVLDGSMGVERTARTGPGARGEEGTGVKADNKCDVKKGDWGWGEEEDEEIEDNNFSPPPPPEPPESFDSNYGEDDDPR